jgi:hypothetical protein
VELVMSVTLNEFLARTKPYEATPVRVTPQMRALTFGAVGVDALSLGVVALARNTVTTPRPGFFILGWGAVRWALTFGGNVVAAIVVLTAILVAAVAFAIWTNGYNEAPERWLYAMVALMATAVLPLLAFAVIAMVVVFNLVLWIAIGILLLIAGALAGLLAFGVLAGLND